MKVNNPIPEYLPHLILCKTKYAKVKNIYCSKGIYGIITLKHPLQVRYNSEIDIVEGLTENNQWKCLVDRKRKYARIVKELDVQK